MKINKKYNIDWQNTIKFSINIDDVFLSTYIYKYSKVNIKDNLLFYEE
jgi:hypothetical protein